MQTPLPFWAQKMVTFDTETTGVSTKTSRIVSACIAILGETGEVSVRHDWLINPGVPIPENASRVHGITNEIAAKSGMEPTAAIKQIIDTLNQYLDLGLPLVVYNAPYDLSLLKNEASRNQLDFREQIKPVLDPLIIDRHVDKYRRGKRTLTAVSEHYSVDLDNAHDAGADAIAAGQVMQAIARKFHDQLPEDVNVLHENQIAWSSEQAESFQEFMRRTRDSSFVADGTWPLQ